MNLKDKRTGYLLLLALALLLSACGSNSAEKTAGTESTPATPGNSQTDSQAYEPFGKFAEPVTVRIGSPLPANDTSLPASDTIDNNQWTRRIQEVTNVVIKSEWAAVTGEAYGQKVKLAISSNTLPDAMLVTRSDLELLVKSGLIEDLTDAYEQYASPRLKKGHAATEGKALADVTFGGKIMAIPNAVPQGDGVRLVWVRKDWLDELNLEIPKTIEDLEKVAQAFIDKDPGNNIGFAGDLSSLDGLFSAYHAYPRMWYKDQDGKVVYGSITPETKQGLLRLQEMFKKGLIDKEFGMRKDTNEPAIAGKAGILFMAWYAPWGPLGDAMRNDPNANWIPLTMPLDEQGQYSTKMQPVTSSYVVVRKGFQRLDAVMKVINMIDKVDEEAKLYDQTINPAYAPLRLVVAATAVEDTYINVSKAYNGEINPDDLAADHRDVYDRYVRVMENKGEIVLDDWQPAMSYMLGGQAILNPMTKVNPVFSSQTKTMELKWPALQKLEEETFYKIIMNKMNIDEFDKFVEQWKSLGGDEITKEVEDAVK